MMGTGEDKLRFDVFSETTSEFTSSCFAYVTPELALDLKRQHLYRVRFNNNPDYPQIVEIVEELASQK